MQINVRDCIVVSVVNTTGTGGRAMVTDKCLTTLIIAGNLVDLEASDAIY
jgi:hypothetical protein